MPQSWISDRAKLFDSSGIRRVFDLARDLKDPIDLSIGQPDFDVPAPVQDAAIAAIQTGKNGYTVSQGIAPLRDKLQQKIRARYDHADREVFVSSGTSGGLVLAMLAAVNPGDEVIVFDPYFVMYKTLVDMVGGRCVFVDTYPDFRIDPDRVRSHLSPRTKMILFNSPANPTGAVSSEEEIRGLAQLAAERDILLISDEIYRDFCHDQPFISPAQFNEHTVVVDGFSKTYAVTGWRLGYVHGPAALVDTMVKLQQYTFVCAPQPAQWAGLAALDVDMSQQVAAYRSKRDLLVAGLEGYFEFSPPGGAFYLFPKTPWGTGSQFVEAAIGQQLLSIPGNVFSRQDTHFRLSYAVADATIQRGIEVLRELAERNGG